MTDEDLIRFTLHGMKIVPDGNAIPRDHGTRIPSICAMIRRARPRRAA